MRDTVLTLKHRLQNAATPANGAGGVGSMSSGVFVGVPKVFCG